MYLKKRYIVIMAVALIIAFLFVVLFYLQDVLHTFQADHQCRCIM